MDNLVVNAVAPWQGYLHWLGNIREGNGKNGPWAFADFTLKYSDHKMQEKYITFTIGDVDKVNMLKGLQIGTPLKVGWTPEATENTQTERWYSTNRAYNVSVIRAVETPAPQKQERITAHSYPQPQPPLPESGNTGYAPMEDGSDLPF